MYVFGVRPLGLTCGVEAAHPKALIVDKAYLQVSVLFRYTVGMTCVNCGAKLPTAGRGRIPRFCSTRCRVAAHRARRQIPARLRSRARWVRHDRKRPITAGGSPASSTDPATWSTYATAKGSTVGDGLGFVLGDGIACLDLDHCLTDGKPADWAEEILNATDGAYAEVSPSGDGLHIWGTAPEQRGRRRDRFEVYSVGRYITVTGNVHRPGALADLSSFF